MRIIDDSSIYKEYKMPPCALCAHWREDSRNCSAFFDTDIPDEIWTDGNQHAETVKGDNGITFEELQK